MKKEHSAYCSRCRTVVEVFEDDKVIRCLRCGHHAHKSDIKMMTGNDIVKWFKSGARIDVSPKK